MVTAPPKPLPLMDTTVHAKAGVHTDDYREIALTARSLRRSDIGMTSTSCAHCGHTTKSRHLPGCCGLRVCTPCRNHKCGKETM